MTGSEQLFGDPASMGRRIKDAVREATGGLTASVGLSATKYVAKVASGRRKRDGLTVVTPGEAKIWLAPLSVSRLWGAGPKTQARLHHLGLHTIGDVADADPQFLSAMLGSAGLRFHTLAQAEDPRPVIGRRASKSVGSEHTLDKDVRETTEIKLHLRRSAEAIGRRLRQQRYLAFGVGVKLKTTDFQILSRQRRLSEPTDVTEMLYSVGVDLLNEFDQPGFFRLVGMVAYDLVGIDDRIQLDLFSASARQRRLDVAIDELAERFGSDVVYRADDLSKPRRVGLAPTLDFLDDRTPG
jgi:DNA polymerase-4